MIISPLFLFKEPERLPDLCLHIPSKVILGVDAIHRIGTLVSEIAERILIVTEAILYEKKTIQRVQELLEKKGIKHITFDEVIPNATSTVVEDGVKLARVSHVDAVIGLGGIKTLCTAKCIAMVTPTKKTIDQYLLGYKPEENLLPYIEIPTTCRNPFMLTDEYLIVDARDRKGNIGTAQQGITKLVIIDPELSSSLPLKYTGTTVLSTLLYAIEGYISNRSTFFSDLVFSKAIDTISTIIPSMVEHPEDSIHRVHASTAGLLVAIGLINSQAGIGTALSYAINASLMVPKSWVASILLPHILEFHVTNSAEKLAHVAALLGESTEGLQSQDAAKKAVDGVRRLLALLKLPTRLRDFDLKLDDMVVVVETAYSYKMINEVPRQIKPDDMYEIIKSAY
jgi:alcohol dehydrogenase class IV